MRRAELRCGKCREKEGTLEGQSNDKCSRGQERESIKAGRHGIERGGG